MPDGTQWRYDGVKWTRPTGPGVLISATAPANPVVNQGWLDTTNDANQLKVWNGSEWLPTLINNPLHNWTLINANLQGDISGLPPPPGAIGEFRSIARIEGDIWQTWLGQAVTLTLPAGEWLIAGMVTFWHPSVIQMTSCWGAYTGAVDPLPGTSDMMWGGCEGMDETGRSGWALPIVRGRGTTNFNVGLQYGVWRNVSAWPLDLFNWWVWLCAQRYR
jgi:hypothetical protein